MVLSISAVETRSVESPLLGPPCSSASSVLASLSLRNPAATQMSNVGKREELLAVLEQSAVRLHTLDNPLISLWAAMRLRAPGRVLKHALHVAWHVANDYKD